MSRALIAATALIVAAACNDAPPRANRDEGSPPMTVADARPAEARHVILTLHARRILDRDPAHALAAWPAYAGVVDAAHAASVVATLSGPAVTARDATARIAVAASGGQSFVLPLDADYRLQVQLDGWEHRGERIALKGLRLQSSYKPDLGVGSTGTPNQPVTVTVPIGGVYLAAGPSFSSKDVAYIEVVEVTVDEVATAVPAGAVTGDPVTADQLAEAWSSWPKVSKQTLP